MSAPKYKIEIVGCGEVEEARQGAEKLAGLLRENGHSIQSADLVEITPLSVKEPRSDRFVDPISVQSCK
jgi:hypothetical protein